MKFGPEEKHDKKYDDIKAYSDVLIAIYAWFRALRRLDYSRMQNMGQSIQEWTK